MRWAAEGSKVGTVGVLVVQGAGMDLTSLYESNPYAVVAAVGATAAILPLSTMLLGRASKPPPPFLSRQWQSLRLVSIEKETHNVQRLTYVTTSLLCIVQ